MCDVAAGTPIGSHNTLTIAALASGSDDGLSLHYNSVPYNGDFRNATVCLSNLVVNFFFLDRVGWGIFSLVIFGTPCHANPPWFQTTNVALHHPGFEPLGARFA